jgi:transcriptional regulator with XRE-family HTH domain
MGKRPKGNEETGAAEYEALLKTVASRIREERIAAKLSQAQLAAKTGLKQSYVYELETGGSNITLKTLSRVASALAVAPRDLLPADAGTQVSPADYQQLVRACARIASLLDEVRAHPPLRLALEREAGVGKPGAARKRAHPAGEATGAKARPASDHTKHID